MGRIRQNVIVNGDEFWALFDTGARNTYITKDAAKELPIFGLDAPETVSLGGAKHLVTESCVFKCTIEGLPVRALARVIEEIGVDEGGKTIEVLIGALTMQEWGIRLVPEREELDMTHYPREFVEFWIKKNS